MKSVKISDIIIWAVFGLSCACVLWFLASFAEVVTHNINSAEEYVPSAWNLFKTFAR